MPLLSDYPEASTEQDLLIPVQVKGEKEWRHLSLNSLSIGSGQCLYETSIEYPIITKLTITT